MKQGHSGEAESLPAGQEIPSLLWNPKANCRVHNRPPLDPTLSQVNAVHTLTPYFLKTHFNIPTPFAKGAPSPG